MAALEGATTRRARPDSLSLHQSGAAGSGIYERVWTQEPLPSEAAPQDQDSGGTWLLTGNGSEHQRLASLLDAAGQRAILIPDAASCREALARSTGSEPIQGIVHLAAPPLGRGDEPTGELILEEASRECEAVLRVLASAATSELRPPPEIWLVTRGAQSVGRPDDMAPPTLAPLWGLGATLAFEHPELRCVRVDLSPGGDPGDELHGLCQELTHRDRADQVAYRDGRRYVARIESKGKTSVGDSLAADARQLRISDYGSLDNLELRPMTRRKPGPGEVEIRVVASGLNFRDVLRALGMATGVASQRTVDSPTDMLFGFECAGTICTVGPGVQRFRVGDAVMASQTVGTIGSFVTLDANFVIPKPDTLSFPEAATIPLAYLTAYHGLMTCAAMQPGERVLIHAAAGGVGQAALRLARLTGAHVYATCHPRKWESLQSMGLERVMSSRTLDFADQVMEATNGQGVQIVLNSLNGEFIPKSLDVLSPGGRFVELGKLGTWTEAQVRSHRADVAYFPFDVGEITEHSPHVIASTLATISSELNEGRLSPLPHRVFPVEEAVSAFRYMQQSKHVGKVVIAQTDHTTTTVADRLSPDATYLVTGGLRGLGLEVSKWLAAKGARHLVVLGRRGPTAAAGEALDGLRQSGVQVLVAQADVSRMEELARVFDQVRASMPPLRGVVHAAGVLDDGVLLQQNVERLRRVMEPKVAGAWNLHLMTRELPAGFLRELLVSRVAARIPWPGQLRRCQRLPRQPGALPPPARAGRPVGELGPVGRRRHGRRSRRPSPGTPTRTQGWHSIAGHRVGHGASPRGPA